MIRGVIFDCFGVLYGGSLEALISLCPPSRVQELRDLNKQSDYGIISGYEYVEGLAEVLGTTRAGVESILSHKHIRNQPLIDFVESLRPRYKVGLLSNVSSGTIDHLFPAEQRAALFDAVVLSCEEHLAKPNPEVFVVAAERMGLAPGECIMIDDRADNCEGAEVAGMQSILYTSDGQVEEELNNILQ